MQKKDSQDLSWSLRFIVTAVSFFIFSAVIKLIAGSYAEVAIFIKIGFVSLGLALLSYSSILTARLVVKKGKKI
jgi:hypothetical protein